MQNNRELHLLLIEDDLGDQKIFQAILEEISAFRCRISFAENLQDGIAVLVKDVPDIVFVDINLPDSQGNETIRRILTQNVSIPVVVLSGLDTIDLPLDMIRAGVQDYLPKSELSAVLVERLINHSIERHFLRSQLLQLQKDEDNSRIETFFERLTGTDSANITAQTFGIHPLKESVPAIFEELYQQYMELLDKSLEQRVVKVNYSISAEMKQLAEDLGFLKANPKDVIHIHRRALQELCATANQRKANAYIDEGRLLVLELMGYLVLHYRKYSFIR